MSIGAPAGAKLLGFGAPGIRYSSSCSCFSSKARAKEKMKRRNLKLKLPPSDTSISNFLSSSGTFRDGDLMVNMNGLHIISQDSAASTPSTDDTFSIEDFEAVRVIGKGGGGVVQLVRHKWTGQLFALKIIQMNIEDNVRRQIVQELKINQASQCPYVVVCYHAFYTNGAISIVLEFMDRGSLADVIRDFRTLAEPYLAIICKQVLLGLAYLHYDRRVIHRDIKPSNLLVNHKGEVKITDFGVSATVTNSMAQRDTFVGTYNYMSPERISGSTHGHDSDIWSLGLVVIECATGIFPYLPPDPEQGWSNFYELLDTIVSNPPPTLPSNRFSSELCSFVSNCVQKDPKDRFSATRLLEHPFIKKYEGQGFDLLGEFVQDWSPLVQNDALFSSG